MKKLTAIMLTLALLITLTSCDKIAEPTLGEPTLDKPTLGEPTFGEPTPEPPEPKWLSPVIAVESSANTLSLYEGELALDGLSSDVLIENGALKATLRVAYGGDTYYTARVGAFVYSFFDYERPVRLPVYSDEVLVLWQNPDGQWFNLMQTPIGHSPDTLGEPNFFLLNAQTVAQLSELEVFIVPTVAPARNSHYDRSGYVLMFAVELPDERRHFHGREMIAAASVALAMEGQGD